MKKLIGCLGMLWVVLMAQWAWSANEAGGQVAGEGRFYSQEEDDADFIKQQLLDSAYRDVMTKELKALGLNPELFWKKYDEKFEANFASTQEGLKKKYKIGTDPKANEAEYNKELRNKKLNAKVKFGQLSRGVISYSVKQMNRSTQVPNSRYMQLDAKIDRAWLHQTYLSFTEESGSSAYNTLFLTVNFELENASWQDLGVDTETDFTQVVIDHWKNQLKGKLQNRVQHIEQTAPGLLDKIKKIHGLPNEAWEAVADTGATSSGPTSAQAMSEDLTPELKRSLWLQINVNLNKLEDDSLTKQRKFRITGYFVLAKLFGHQVLAHYDFPKTDTKLSFESLHEYSSNLASSIYQIPLAELSQMASKLPLGDRQTKWANLEVSKMSSIQDVNELLDLLRSKGVALQVQPELSAYDGVHARLKVSYSGDANLFRDFLIRLKGMPVNQSKTVSIPNQEAPFKLEFQNGSKKL